MANPPSLPLGEVFTIAQVQEMYTRMGKLLESNVTKPLTIDGSKLIKMDAAGVQLLTVFLREIKNTEKQVVLKNPSSVLVDSFRTLGLASEIEIFIKQQAGDTLDG